MSVLFLTEMTLFSRRYLGTGLIKQLASFNKKLDQFIAHSTWPSFLLLLFVPKESKNLKRHGSIYFTSQ